MFFRKKGMVDMQNQLAQMVVQQLGFGPVGEIHMLSKSGENSHNYWRSRINDANFHQNTKTAYDAMVTKRNDVLLVCPSSHVWYGTTGVAGAVLTWAKQNTHMIGMDPGGKGGYQRARFGASGYAQPNLLGVTSHSNKFKNLRFMHGASTGGASDVRCMTVSGAGNVFENICFGGPSDTTQSASGNYRGVTLASATQNHFKNCMFGTNNLVKRAANSMLDFTGTGGSNVFEDCLFVYSAAGTTTEVIAFDSTGVGICQAYFLNCQFINMYPTALPASAITCATLTEGAPGYLYFDSRCQFAGVSEVMVSGKEDLIWFGHSTMSTDLDGAADYKALGLAAHPEN